MRYEISAALIMLSVISACSDGNTSQAAVDTTLPEVTPKKEETGRNSSAEIGSISAKEYGKDILFENASMCVFDKATTDAMEKMLEWDWENLKASHASSVTIGAQRLPVRVKEETDQTFANSRIIESSVRFPDNSKWNGLELSRLIVGVGYYPESDGYNSRGISFLNSPTEVQDALGEQGIYLPIAPDYLSIDDGGCGGSIQIQSLDGGAAVSCGFGC